MNRLAYRGPAERAGLRVGDVITALDGRPVGAPKLARRGVIAWIRGSTHRVTVRRPGGAQTLAVRVTRRPKAPGYVRLFLTHAPLPDFTLPRVGAPGSVTFSKLRGKVVLVLFWASWCAVCKTVLPLLARLHRRYAAAGLAVVAVSRDARLAPLQGAIAQQRLPFYVAHDRKNGVGKKNRDCSHSAERVLLNQADTWGESLIKVGVAKGPRMRKSVDHRISVRGRMT